MTLKSLNYSLLVISLESEDFSILANELNTKRIMAPEFFQHAPVVVNVENSALNLDFLEIQKIVTEHHFILAGISGELSDKQKATLHVLQIAIMRSSKKQISREVVIEEKVADGATEKIVEQASTHNAYDARTQLFKGRVRSGQQIYAKDCDLVITGDVGAGAEVIADGNIHIYGALRGRALAGAMGDPKASIFCQLLAPELVSVAGVYKLSDALPGQLIGKSCIVSLLDEQLVVDRLNQI